MASSANRSCGLRMCLRLRPNEDPTKISVLERQGPKSVLLRDTRNERYEDKSYSFDAVYDEQTTETMYQYELGDRALEPLFQGKHCTVFAHGATGSGKTYTMQGDDLQEGGDVAAGVASEGSSCSTASPRESNKSGFIPLAVRNILNLYEKDGRKEEYRIWFSLFELYCDKVRDLLQDLPKEKPFGGLGITTRRWLGEGNPHVDVNSRTTAGEDARGGKNSRFDDLDGGQKPKYRIDDLPVQMDKSGEEVVAQVERVEIDSLEQFQQLYQRRIKLRKSGATSLNLCSSRSHCCVQISVEKIGPEKTAEVAKTRSVMSYHAKPVQQQIGKLFMVDLAGCEDNRETDTAGRGARIDESKKINSTYLSLVKVFRALRRGEQLKPVCRDDKLTRLLRVALESSSIPTLVLITVHPVPDQLQAILNTFSYLNIPPDSGGSLVKNLADTIIFQTDKHSSSSSSSTRPTSARNNPTADEGSNAASGDAANPGTGVRTPPSPSRRDTKARRFASPPASRPTTRGGGSSGLGGGLGGGGLRQSKDESNEAPVVEKKPIQRNHTPTRSLRPPGHALSLAITRSGTPRRNFSVPQRAGVAGGPLPGGVVDVKAAAPAGGSSSSTADGKGDYDDNPRTRTLTSSNKMGKLQRSQNGPANSSTNESTGGTFLKKRSGLNNKGTTLSTTMNCMANVTQSNGSNNTLSKSMCNIDRKAFENPEETKPVENQNAINPFLVGSNFDFSMQGATSTTACNSVSSSASSKEIPSKVSSAEAAGADVEMVDTDAEENFPHFTPMDAHDASDDIDSSRQTSGNSACSSNSASNVKNTVRTPAQGVSKGGIFAGLSRQNRGNLAAKRNGTNNGTRNTNGGHQETGRQEFGTQVSNNKGRRPPNSSTTRGNSTTSNKGDSIPHTPIGNNREEGRYCESPKGRNSVEEHGSRVSSRGQTSVSGGGDASSGPLFFNGEDFVSMAEKNALVRGFQQRDREQQNEINELKAKKKKAEDQERDTRVLLRQKSSELQLRTEETQRLEEELCRKNETILNLRNQNQELNNELNHTQFGIRERDDEIQVLKNTVEMLKLVPGGSPSSVPGSASIRSSLIQQDAITSNSTGKRGMVRSSNGSSPLGGSSHTNYDHSFQGLNNVGARIVNGGQTYPIFIEGGHTHTASPHEEEIHNNSTSRRRSSLRSNNHVAVEEVNCDDNPEPCTSNSTNHCQKVLAMNHQDQFGISPDFEEDSEEDDCMMMDGLVQQDIIDTTKQCEVAMPRHNNFLRDLCVEQQESDLHDHNPMASSHDNLPSRTDIFHAVPSQNGQQHPSEMMDHQQFGQPSEVVIDDAIFEQSFHSKTNVNQSHESFHSEISDMHVDTDGNESSCVRRNEPEGFGFNIIDNADGQGQSLMGYMSGGTRSPDDNCIL